MQEDREAAAMAEIARRTGRTRTVSIMLAFPIVFGISAVCAGLAWFIQALAIERVYSLIVGVAFAAPLTLVFRIAPMLGDWWLMVRSDDWVKAIAEQQGLAESDVREMLTVFE